MTRRFGALLDQSAATRREQDFNRKERRNEGSHGRCTRAGSCQDLSPQSTVHSPVTDHAAFIGSYHDFVPQPQGRAGIPKNVRTEYDGGWRAEMSSSDASPGSRSWSRSTEGYLPHRPQCLAALVEQSQRVSLRLVEVTRKVNAGNRLRLAGAHKHDPRPALRAFARQSPRLIQARFQDASCFELSFRRSLAVLRRRPRAVGR